MRVLYVEDDPSDADLALRMLRKTAPYINLETVSTINDALSRLEAIDTEPLDLVLMDMHLRDGDGLSLLKHIRETGLQLAVVLITGAGDEETAVAALKGRADDYVIKRKDYLDRLPITLESALNHYRADAARLSNPLKVLYLDADLVEVEKTSRHFAVHASHIHLEPVSTWLSALSALQLQKGDPYHVLLMRLHLTELIALEVLKELRLKHVKDIPVVLLCEAGHEDLGRQGLRLGASSYLICNPGYVYQLPWELEQAHARAELERREAALNASEARNRAILSAIPDLMFLLGRDGTFLDYHCKEDDLLLAPPEQFVGKNIREVLPAELASDFMQCFEKAFASEKPVIMEYTMAVPQGTRVFEASVVSCDGDKILSMVRDITERKQAEESLRKALAEVQQLKDRLHNENIYLQEEIRVASNFGEIIGRSDALRRVLSKAEQVAPLNTTVLLLGETGTGKELLAHAIHNLSPRAKRPLVKVNCAALPGPLIESDLFGHVKGAFTGADARRSGRFEIADGGTIFLDEVGELPLDLQAKLLRVLEDGEFEPVGSSRTARVDVRVIAATNRNLDQAVHQGTFRSDLYYRLSIFPITLPPLRERQEDIPMLVTHLVRQLSLKLGKKIDTISQETMTVLKNYSWPGNVRELRNVIERAAIITQGSKLQLTDTLESPSLTPGQEAEIALDQDRVQGSDVETLEESEYNLILRTLKKVHWRLEGRGGAAELLNINPSTLRSRMRKLRISRAQIQSSERTKELT